MWCHCFPFIVYHHLVVRHHDVDVRASERYQPSARASGRSSDCSQVRATTRRNNPHADARMILAPPRPASQCALSPAPELLRSTASRSTWWRTNANGRLSTSRCPRPRLRCGTRWPLVRAPPARWLAVSWRRPRTAVCMCWRSACGRIGVALAASGALCFGAWWSACARPRVPPSGRAYCT